MEGELLNMSDSAATGEQLNNVELAEGIRTQRTKGTSRYGAAMSYVCLVLSAAITIYFTYLGFESYLLFSWHPSLATIGFMVLMAQAIMAFSPDNVLVRSLSRQARVRTHWILMTLSVVAILVSFVVMVFVKIERGKHHFVTFHAISGLVSIILSVLASGGGVAALYTTRLKKLVKPATVKLGHIVAGIVAFAVGVACLIASVFTHFFTRVAGTTPQVFCIIVLVVAGVLTLVNSVKSAYGRFRSLALRQRR